MSKRGGKDRVVLEDVIAVVSHDKWIEARTAFLAKEKEFTRVRDDLGRQRRALPWEKVDKSYVFDGSRGKETLADLFGKKSQLIVYHFMFNPDDDAGCPSCSFWADNFNGIDVHLAHRDASFVAISRAPLARSRRSKKRMGCAGVGLLVGHHPNYDYQRRSDPEETASGLSSGNYRRRRWTCPDAKGPASSSRTAAGHLSHLLGPRAASISSTALRNSLTCVRRRDGQAGVHAVPGPHRQVRGLRAGARCSGLPLTLHADDLFELRHDLPRSRRSAITRSMFLQAFGASSMTPGSCGIRPLGLVARSLTSRPRLGPAHAAADAGDADSKESVVEAANDERLRAHRPWTIPLAAPGANRSRA
jgi:predicted dithiol-disulfide oxidoreductase (DUF899 family)